MDGATLARAMGGSLPSGRYEELAPAFTEALRQAGCTMVKRAAMFCAQLGHESAGLLYMEEIASGSAYEGRTDLGNTQPGDGVRFKGHGPIQITGRANHTAVSKWAHAKGYVPTATYFVDNPQALASDRNGFLGAVWYWTVARDLNTPADAGDINECTRLINGGYNGLDDRKNRYRNCLALGEELLKGSDDMFEKDDAARLERIENKIEALAKSVSAFRSSTRERDQRIKAALMKRFNATDADLDVVLKEADLDADPIA